MSVKTNKSRFQNDLAKANAEIGRLTEESKKQQTHISQLINFLSAILMTKHAGFVDIMPEELRRAAGMNINVRQLSALGFIRISAFLGDPTKVVAPGASQLAPESVAPDDTPSPLSCSDLWHVDPNAVGLRCPECGNRTRLENAPCESAVV